MHMLSRGFLITFEGIDGSGKSTNAHLLYETLKNSYVTLLTKEPGGTKLGQKIRTILQSSAHKLDSKTEFLLFAADRAEHIQKVIKPALQSKQIVISDRLHDSSTAYQGYGRNLDLSLITTVNKWALQDITPDLTIYLKLNPQQVQIRLKQRHYLSSFDQEKISFFEKVTQGFEEIFAQRTNVIMIDALLTPEKICQKIIHFLEKNLPL